MAQLFDIRRVTVGPRALVAEVEVAPSGPLMTSDDPEATGRVMALMPGLADHVCLGDASSRFGEVAGDTETSHLLEHVTVELLAQTDVAGDIMSGQTRQVGERAYEITLACPDDVLVAGALSSAAWILQWAYSGGGEPQPDVEATVGGLVALVQSLGDPAGEKDAAPEVGSEMPAEDVGPDPEPEPVVDEQPAEQLPLEFVPDEVAPAPVAAPEPEQEAGVSDLPPASEEPMSEEGAPRPEASEVTEDASEPPTPGPWDRNDIPRPHLVR